MQPNQGELKFAIQQFAARYPSSKWGPANQTAFEMRLQFFELEDVEAGLNDAADSKCTWIPDLTTVCEFVVKREKTRKLELERDESRRARGPRPPAEDTSHVPTDPEEAAAYIADADNQYEQFARQCEVDSKQIGLDGEKLTPGELGGNRARETQKLLDGIGRRMP
jgi:hypothetical protein